MSRGARRLAVAATIVLLALVVAPRPAPADIEEQRARLPPPTACADPVEGTWMSYEHYPDRGQWYITTLYIRRAPDPTLLVGEMHGRAWHGGDEMTQPPPTCGPSVYYRSSDGHATGSDDHGRVTFTAIDVRPGTEGCGNPSGTTTLDTFSGTIDPTRQEFQSLLNNPPYWVNVPVVFRRVSCATARDAPAPIAVPPPARTSGCDGCTL